MVSPLRSVGPTPVAVAPCIHVKVLLVQIALLLVAVVGHITLPGPRVGAREATLYLNDFPVFQEVLRPGEVQPNPKVRHQLALLPRNRLVVRHLLLFSATHHGAIATLYS